MAQIVKLRDKRKTLARDDARRKADQNAAKFGRTKAARDLAKAQAEKAARDLDALKRE